MASANVAVTNTTGLYGITSTTPVLNSAQQLLTLLANNNIMHILFERFPEFRKAVQIHANIKR